MNPRSLLDRLAHGQLTNVRFADAQRLAEALASSWTGSGAATTSTGTQASAKGSTCKPAVARPSRISSASSSTWWSDMPSD